MTKPDFIIIGAMKSATSTLHSQLALQSGIFMSNPKEPNYFSDDEQYAKGEAWYADLFAEAKTNDICGESSTHYTKLPDYPLATERMAKRLEKVKLIYVMRHPVDRLVSHYIHQWSQNIIKCDINEAIDKYPELTNYSCYAMQLQPYFEEFGKAAILPIFTELLKVAPQAQLDKVTDFIGYKEAAYWEYELDAQNVSNARLRRFKGYKYLVESNLMTVLRRAIVPKRIRDRVKKGLVMHKRPVINPDNLARLTALFDSDLSKLSEWLNTEINCKNYHVKIKEL